VRKIVVHMQTTLDNRIATGDGGLWEPFAWGEAETAHLTRYFAEADTWALSRVLHEQIVPWWDAVAAGETPPDAPAPSAADRAFAAVLAAMTKVVFSSTLDTALGRVVLSGDLAARLAELKRGAGRHIMVSAGPATLAPLIATPGLIDEYLVAVHPAVLAGGPRMFDGLGGDLALRLIDGVVFDGGAALLHYATRPAAG
jgi:dihydrofolate reductase